MVNFHLKSLIFYDFFNNLLKTEKIKKFNRCTRKIIYYLKSKQREIKIIL